MKSLDIWFPEQGRVEAREQEVAGPGAGEVLLEARASLISTGTECIVLQGLHEPGTHWANWGRFPFAPGYSMVGRVAAVGPGVQGVAVGDRLAARVPHRQYQCISHWVTSVPPEVPDRDAAWHGIACIVQNGVRRACIALGETVVVVGLGILGQLVCQYARLCGARAVIGVDPAADRAESSRRSGATHVVSTGVESAAAEVSAITRGRMADVVFDVTGHPDVFAAALSLPRTLGRFVLLGDTGFPSRQHLTADVIRRGVAVLGAHDGNPPRPGNDYYYWSHQHMADLFLDLLAQGRMDVRSITSHVESPRQAPEVYRGLIERRGSHLGVLFDWSALGGAGAAGH